MILTYDEEETLEKDGKTIKILPVWKWLIQNSL
jgi:predicted AAA+ superfamily ATPase